MYVIPVGWDTLCTKTGWAVTDMEELSANAGINTVTNCIKGLNNVISSQKSGGMAFFRER